ncbi:membrane protein [Sulfuricaulis limicola]|uniref:Membrane protein n=1 Tax=Sulfuricaulis limicola TaxID=1620215 RepID=A0A1B4XJG4_9GAMM|nr:DUF2167 domain-containing protein [Sulfuricaulis limicola]BAV34945.1 membrane protein [Sulfuricaulis limicola]
MTTKNSFGVVPLVLLVLSLALPMALPAAETPSAADQEYEAAVKAASQVLQRGPTEAKLLDQATIKLPEGYGFIPSREAGRYLRAIGNVLHADPVGLILPIGENRASWFVVVEWDKAGYIKDDDAKDWKADELLDSIKEGTKAGNEERRSRGIPELEVIGWVETPKYDAMSHQLVWSVSSKHTGDTSSSNRGINYNTYALGREGYFSLNLVTDLNSIEADKPAARTLLSGMNFTGGKSYADFNSSTDRVAEYGLAALVAGVAAKKLGLLAVIAAFFVKFAKIIAVVGVAVLVSLRKWWKGREGGGMPKT